MTSIDIRLHGQIGHHGEGSDQENDYRSSKSSVHIFSKYIVLLEWNFIGH